MEEIYFIIQGSCKLINVSKHNIELLLSYSKSLRITVVDGFHFETNLN